MKKLPLVLFLLLLFCTSGSAQDKAACPKITVETSPIAVIDGYPMIFMAKVTGADLSKLKYKWTLSNGEILEGQGTPEIKVDTLGYQGEEIEVTVEVVGISTGCGNRASAIGRVKPKPYLNEVNADDCPKIKVIGPSSSISPGDEAIFTSAISGVDNSKLEYIWAVSSGEIVNGQGTPVIRVSTKGLRGIRIVAEVIIKGFPEKCFNRGNETADIGHDGGHPPKIDEYGNLSWGKEKIRLNSVAEHVKNSPRSNLMIIVSFSKGTTSAQKKNRISKIEKYLTSVHKLGKDNFQIVDGGESEFKTEIYWMLQKPTLNSGK